MLKEKSRNGNKLLVLYGGLMEVELNKNEIDFISQCVFMAAREGFYSLDWNGSEYNYEEVGRSVLHKLGLDDKIANDYMNGF